ncbi:NAD-dependent epimerase/dehydratase family protein [Jiangella aurantiaca]|uniref:NAD-dependent epimerase/dehydratase family protein n=1 Tax=Jiangella aurantiaca TaxID=2530373 RepID=A0A4R5A5V3_9ACTN|nr:NAD-dependent epimerase/dehydratase family protein [Jiangella aurantiaca]TDD67408.1 NAD-dependent epimerase/dehydratase family protein [Jiangella aurantiaca]
MRIVVVGGTGHVGTYLIPRLVAAGHQVVNLSRGARAPYADHPAWGQVDQLVVDREAEDRAGTFAGRVADLAPDVVVDMVCFTEESAHQLIDGLRGRVAHLVHCGSIWMHGPSRSIPLAEDSETVPFGEYGVQKAAIARLLIDETARGGLVTTSLHPGHISGPGWHPINPLGNLDPSVWTALASGAPLPVPGIGAELLHHVHADDVAQGFQLAIENRDAAAGQAFHVTAPSALTVRGFAEYAAGWFGRTPSLEFVSWDEFRARTAPEYAEQSWDHLSRSQFASIDKARRLLGYAPRYAPGEAVREAVEWLARHGELDLELSAG